MHWRVLSSLLMVVTWSFAMVASRIVVDGMPIFLFRASSFGIAAGCVLIAAAIHSAKPVIAISDLPTVFVSGIFKVAAYALFVLAAQTMTLTLRVAMLALLFPLFQPLVELLIKRRVPHWSYAIALALGCAGMALVAWPMLQSPLETTALKMSALAALSWLIGYAFEQIRPVEGDMLAATGWELMVAALLSTALTTYFRETIFLPEITVPLLAAYAYYVLFGLVLTHILFAATTTHNRILTGLLTMVLLPPATFGASMLLLGERPLPHDYAGLALEVAGLSVLAATSLVAFRRKGAAMAQMRAERMAEPPSGGLRPALRAEERRVRV